LFTKLSKTVLSLSQSSKAYWNYSSSLSYYFLLELELLRLVFDLRSRWVLCFRM
jgi:hypothetical protein